MKTLISALVLALAIPAAVQAAPQATTSVAARYGDLDLNSATGAAQMLKRLDRAALAVCGASTFSVREYQRAVRATDCYADAMSGAVSSLGAPSVSSAFHARGAALASN